MLKLKKGMMEKVYKVTNISGYVSTYGLYPGESKKIKSIDDLTLKKLVEKGLLSISVVEEKINKNSKKEESDNNEILKKEVIE